MSHGFLFRGPFVFQTLQVVGIVHIHQRDRQIQLMHYAVHVIVHQRPLQLWKHEHDPVEYQCEESHENNQQYE
jgi:hypothetical protein